jgi:hypothetical protein
MPRRITYEFTLSQGTVWRYDLDFDDQNRLIPPVPKGPPRPWTNLEFEQCPHCPLQPADSPQCPVARNIECIVEDSKETVSHARASVCVVTPERTYSKDCTTQEGLGSLFGLIMACSGCPHLDWLRPLARFHLPFSDPDETLFRVLSLQFVESFLGASTMNLTECTEVINQRYGKVEKVNKAFIQRIRSYSRADADKNALAALDLFAQFFALDRDADFEQLRKMFPSAGAKA